MQKAEMCILTVKANKQASWFAFDILDAPRDEGRRVNNGTSLERSDSFVTWDTFMCMACRRKVEEFLDLRLSLNTGLCWSYGKPSMKPLLPANRIHLKQIKRSLVDCHIY